MLPRIAVRVIRLLMDFVFENLDLKKKSFILVGEILCKFTSLDSREDKYLLSRPP